MKYTLRRNRRARHLHLRVVPPGHVVVSAPTWLDIQTIEQFLLEKAAWLGEKLDLVKRIPRRKSQREREKEYQEMKEGARCLVEDRVAKFNLSYQFPVGRITIRNQKTRWGSCSSKGNLSFNYRIVFLSPEEQDYIVVHELCHLQEMNHSPRFWALVAKSIPEYRLLRQALRKRSLSLM